MLFLQEKGVLKFTVCAFSLYNVVYLLQFSLFTDVDYLLHFDLFAVSDCSNGRDEVCISGVVNILPSLATV